MEAPPCGPSFSRPDQSTDSKGCRNCQRGWAASSKYEESNRADRHYDGEEGWPPPEGNAGSHGEPFSSAAAVVRVENVPSQSSNRSTRHPGIASHQTTNPGCQESLQHLDKQHRHAEAQPTKTKCVVGTGVATTSCS